MRTYQKTLYIIFTSHHTHDFETGSTAPTRTSTSQCKTHLFIRFYWSCTLWLLFAKRFTFLPWTASQWINAQHHTCAFSTPTKICKSKHHYLAIFYFSFLLTFCCLSSLPLLLLSFPIFISLLLLFFSVFSFFPFVFCFFATASYTSK